MKYHLELPVKVRGELRHALDPQRMRIVWAVVYVLLTGGIIGGSYLVADHIKTRTLPTGDIVLNTTYSRYVVGEVIGFTLTNRYNTTIYVTNECPSEPLAVYRLDSGIWKRLHDSASAKDCPNQQRQVSIPANSAVTSSFAAWHNLFTVPGKYRLAAVVDQYDSLPYVDFDVVAKAELLPPAAAAAPNGDTAGRPALPGAQPTVSNAPTSSGQTLPPAATPSPSPGQVPSPQPAPVPPPAPAPAVTYVVHVNSGGTYDVSSLTLNSGDSIQFAYSAPRTQEVRTSFTPKAPTTTSLGSVTVDSEFTTRTKKFTATGTWTFKAADHSGNTVSLTVK